MLCIKQYINFFITYIYIDFAKKAKHEPNIVLVMLCFMLESEENNLLENCSLTDFTS